MLSHEKKAFYKFFSTYFISVALLILSAGYFYYQQTYNQLFKAEHFSVIKYARHLKSDDLMQDENFKFEIDESKIENFSMDNIKLTSTHFIKRVPYEWDHGYYVIYKKRHIFDVRVEKLFFTVLSFQVFLLLLFAFISLRLAKNALKPMQEAIHKLDSFSKDLIHDLNTP
ncbi:sensor histidine kinase, partial [Sulfurimonas sp. MAG313]|nr:sensor histidine kinase [Sulfurimonas sp. MAG313]